MNQELFNKLKDEYVRCNHTEKYYFLDIVTALLEGDSTIMDKLYGIIPGDQLPELGIVTPYVTTKIKPETKPSMSYGVEPWGYTFTLGENYITDAGENKTSQDGTIVMQPKQSILCHSIEKWSIPEDVTGLIFLKSSYMRQFVSSQFAPIDGGFCNAQLTFMLTNNNSKPVSLTCGQGIAQAIFFRGSVLPRERYSEGYNNQKRNGVVEFNG